MAVLTWAIGAGQGRELLELEGENGDQAWFNHTQTPTASEPPTRLQPRLRDWKPLSRGTQFTLGRAGGRRERPALLV